MDGIWERAMAILGKLPIMQFAAVVWGVAFLVTLTRYAFDHWTPNADWLHTMEITLATVTGHFWVKRHTDYKHAALKNSAPDPAAVSGEQEIPKP